MSELDDWNQLPEADAFAPVLACCGSRAFANGVVRNRPYSNLDSLLAKADDIWLGLQKTDWLEAFACHPRIGEAPANTLLTNPQPGRGKSNPRPAPRPSRSSIRSPQRTASTKRGMASSTSSVQAADLLTNCLPSSTAGFTTPLKSNSEKPPSSNDKSLIFESESGWHHERNLYSRPRSIARQTRLQCSGQARAF